MFLSDDSRESRGLNRWLMVVDAMSLFEWDIVMVSLFCKACESVGSCQRYLISSDTQRHQSSLIPQPIGRLHHLRDHRSHPPGIGNVLNHCPGI